MLSLCFFRESSRRVLPRFVLGPGIFQIHRIDVVAAKSPDRGLHLLQKPVEILRRGECRFPGAVHHRRFALGTDGGGVTGSRAERLMENHIRSARESTFRYFSSINVAVYNKCRNGMTSTRSTP